MRPESGMQGLNVGSETWGGKLCIGEGEPQLTLCLPHLKPSLSAGSLENDFQACVFSYFMGTGVFSHFTGAEIISQHPSLIYEPGCRWRPLTHM